MYIHNIKPLNIQPMMNMMIHHTSYNPMKSFINSPLTPILPITNQQQHQPTTTSISTSTNNINQQHQHPPTSATVKNASPSASCEAWETFIPWPWLSVSTGAASGSTEPLRWLSGRAACAGSLGGAWGGRGEGPGDGWKKMETNIALGMKMDQHGSSWINYRDLSFWEVENCRCCRLWEKLWQHDEIRIKWKWKQVISWLKQVWRQSPTPITSCLGICRDK